VPTKTQKTCNWDTKYPCVIHNIPLHVFVVGVECAVNAGRIIRNQCFCETVNLEWYVNNMCFRVLL
jgi:hypothetical protein